MNPDLLHILQHSLGVDQYGKGRRYRNRFVTGPGSDDFEKCQELVAAGMMTDYGPQDMNGRMHTFCVTEAGQRAVSNESPAPPKASRSRKRYLDFLHADCGLSFGEWLKAKQSKEPT